MNPWLSFIIGGLVASVLIGGTGGWMFALLTRTPQMALVATATILRAFSSYAPQLRIVVVAAEGDRVTVDFEQIASAIEHASPESPELEVASHSGGRSSEVSH